jgi:hypothetical protein
MCTFKVRSQILISISGLYLPASRFLTRSDPHLFLLNLEIFSPDLALRCRSPIRIGTVLGGPIRIQFNMGRCRITGIRAPATREIHVLLLSMYFSIFLSNNIALIIKTSGTMMRYDGFIFLSVTVNVSMSMSRAMVPTCQERKYVNAVKKL